MAESGNGSYLIEWHRKSDGIIYILHNDNKFYYNLHCYRGLKYLSFKTLRGAENRAKKIKCNDGYIAVRHTIC